MLIKATTTNNVISSENYYGGFFGWCNTYLGKKRRWLGHLLGFLFKKYLTNHVRDYFTVKILY